MNNSTIKQKLGQCIDCPSSFKHQPLIAKRCKYHYDKHRAEVNEAKRESKGIIKEKKIYTLARSIKPIPKVSKKMQINLAKYTVKKLEFMGRPENKICPITREPTTDIHHRMGRVGFADEWARITNIPLLLDERYFLAVSRRGHKHIEENPDWAKKMKYSLDRLSKN